jgi:hypothetical protein
MDQSPEIPGGKQSASIDEYREIRESGGIGVENFMKGLGDNFTEEQTELVPQIMEKMHTFLTDPKIVDPEVETVKFAAGLSDIKLSFWALGYYSQGFVEKTSPETRASDRDLHAGKLLDNLAIKLSAELHPQNRNPSSNP